MSLVLDSSATLAWVYRDVITEPIRRVFNLVGENGAWVPGLWKLEVANILEMGIKPRAASIPKQTGRCGEPLSNYRIAIDSLCTMRRTWNSRCGADCRWRLSTRN